MIWAKGVADFVRCASIIKKKFSNVRFVLVGAPDEMNPDCIPLNQLNEWNSSGAIEWGGFRDDMAHILEKASIVCFPSTYGEGVPKSLIEAASCKRPIVTYNLPGCKEIVQHTLNGLLVKPKDIDSLVDAITYLLKNRGIAEKMGEKGRELVIKHFSEKIVAEKTKKVWESI